MSFPGGSTLRRRSEQSPELAAAAVSTALVLGNRDLLADILLRLGSPTWLVRAALASKNWLRVASDPDFLDRFRELHPPRILSLNVLSSSSWQRMFPVPQPPDLAAAARLAGRALGNLGRYGTYTDYSNGLLLVESRDSSYRLSYAVTSLLHEGPGRSIPPPPPLSGAAKVPGLLNSQSMLFLKDDGADAMSCLFLSLVCDQARLRAEFSILRSGVWGVPQSAVMELDQELFVIVTGQYLVSRGKVYMRTTGGCIFVLDLAMATFSAIQLPDGAVHCESLKFSHGEHSGLYLMCETGFQLRVWHGDGAGQWSLVDTVSVCEACAQLNVQKWVPDDKETPPFRIITVGDNAEFVILGLVASRIICCMRLNNRVVEKVSEGVLPLFHSFMPPITMVWPPFLPVPPALE